MKNIKKTTSRSIKRELSGFFSDDFSKPDEIVRKYRSDSLIGPVISFFYHHNPLIKFRAVKLLGKIISDLYISEKEKARIIMRRLMWNLNDESGGIGWGSPEAMGEAMALSPGIAKEFGKMLISYTNKEGNYLEHNELQKGALWGIIRCGEMQREIFSPALPFLEDHFNFNDPEIRGLSLLGYIKLGGDEKKWYKNFMNDTSSFKVFADDKFVEFKICDLFNTENPEN